MKIKPLLIILFGIIFTVSIAGFFLVKKSSISWENNSGQKLGEVNKDENYPKSLSESASDPSQGGRDQGRSVIMNPIKKITSLKEVEDILGSFKPKEIGEIRNSGEKKQQLILNGKVIFEAQTIGMRNISDNGTIVLSAVTGSKVPLDRADAATDTVDGKLDASPREIWITDATNQPVLVSQQGIDAVNPVISPNGQYIAFTGRKINPQGFPEGQKLYVTDKTGKALAAFSEPEDHYQVVALDWVNNGKVLRVFTDYGETGGHGEIKYFEF